MLHVVRGLRPVKAVDLMRSGSSPSTVTITNGAVAHTKGSWTQLLAATSGEATLMMLMAAGSRVDATNTSMLLDIGIGAIASEQVIIPNLLAGFSNGGLDRAHLWTVPLFVPAGVRVAARTQGAQALGTITVGVDLWGLGAIEERGFIAAAIDALGVSTATSQGTTATASGTANTKGAWAEVVASAAADYFGFLWSAQGNGSGALTSAACQFDIGIGAAGSEQVLVPDLCFQIVNDENVLCTRRGSMEALIETPVKAGTRIAVRMQASVGSVAADIALYGLRR